MCSKSNNNLTSILILFLILIASESSTAQEVQDEKEFDYSRNGERGPRKWGELNPEWIACSNGTMQSPINLPFQRLRFISNQQLKINYTAANATLRNRGHDIQVEWIGEAGSVTIHGSEYPLRQVHWHSPSEHTINGRRYALELHMVHERTDSNQQIQIAVVSVLYHFGRPDKFLSKLAGNITSLIDMEGEEIAIGMINPTEEIEVPNQDYYKYMGSLTVPPCTEGVTWIVHKQVKTVSRNQVQLLREAVHDSAEENARPLQPRNGRDIFLYKPIRL